MRNNDQTIVNNTYIEYPATYCILDKGILSGKSSGLCPDMKNNPIELKGQSMFNNKKFVI